MLGCMSRRCLTCRNALQQSGGHFSLLAVTRQNGYGCHHTDGLCEMASAIRSDISGWLVSKGVPTAAYVDGLNLYHGLRDAGLLKFRWLDIERMVDSLAADAGASLGMSLDVAHVVYCTSLVADNRAARRQDIYLQALEQHCARLAIRRGKYEPKVRKCANCDAEVEFETEKQTDVNLAVEMLMDAAKPGGRRAEVQLLVTGDTDLIPAIRAVRTYGVEVVAIAPPARGQAKASFAAVSSKTLRVHRRHLRDHPLPDPVVRRSSDGGEYPFRPPDGWTPPSDW